VHVAGVSWQLSKNQCVAKAICENFRDSYLLAIFIQWLNFFPVKDVGSLYFIVKIIVSIKYYIIFCFEH